MWRCSKVLIDVCGWYPACCGESDKGGLADLMSGIKVRWLLVFLLLVLVFGGLYFFVQSLAY